MRTPVLVCCAAVSLAMLGCNPAPDQKAKAPPQPPAPAAMVAQTGAGSPGPTKAKKAVDKKCKKDDCEIKVNVTASCVVTLDLPTVGITKGIHDVPITWTLQDNHFDFATKAVKLKASSSQFTTGSLSPNGKSFTIVDKNDEGDDIEHKYSVFVKRKNGADCPEHDPTIINGY